MWFSMQNIHRLTMKDAIFNNKKIIGDVGATFLFRWFDPIEKGDSSNPLSLWKFGSWGDALKDLYREDRPEPCEYKILSFTKLEKPDVVKPTYEVVVLYKFRTQKVQVNFRTIRSSTQCVPS